MRHLPARFHIKSIHLATRKPWVAFCVLALTILLWLFPLDLRADSRPASPLLAYPVGPPAAGARCPNACLIDVCTRWVPEGHAQCPVGGPGGGCCLSYGQECDPRCEEEDEPQPPSITSSLTCSPLGNGGWCIGALILDLIASDPAGQAVLISGDIDGLAFACAPGTLTCSVPLPDGNGTVNFLVTSATGLTAAGAANYRRDSSPPRIDGDLSGVPGENDWFTSAVTVTASADGAFSGLASFSYSVDGGPWNPYASPFSIDDGVHTLEFQAVDLAGNQSQLTQAVNVDAITPALGIQLTGTLGPGGWYRTDVGVLATAQDAGSGVARFDYELDGDVWRAYSGLLALADGEHHLAFRARDLSGNVTQAEQEINVDSVTPIISLIVAGEPGSAGWYVSPVTIDARASDGGSGLAAFEYSLGGNAWQPYAAPIALAEGRTELRLRAVDYAGNETSTPAQVFLVDTTPPTVEMAEAWSLGDLFEYEVRDEGSGVANVRVVIEDDLERWPKLAWNDGALGKFRWDGRFADGSRAPDGEYFLTLKVSDSAGNEIARSGVITVENNLLTLLLPPFTPPMVAAPPIPAQPVPPATAFGGEKSSAPSDDPTAEIAAGGLTATGSAAGALHFQAPARQQSGGPSGNGLLWGAAAAAALATFAGESARRKLKGSGEQAGGPSGYQQRMRATQRARLEAAWRAEQLALEARRTAPGEARALTKELAIEAGTRAYTAGPQVWPTEAIRPMSQQADAARWNGLAQIENSKPAPWWTKLVDWVDTHQVETALGVGLVVGLGVAAILLTGGLATPLVAAAWIAGGAALAGGTVALGTVALNNHYDRPAAENLWRNLALAAGTAAAVGGAGYLLSIAGVNAIGQVMNFCFRAQAFCLRGGVILEAVDVGEQYYLAVKAPVQNWLGDTEGALETYNELQSELNDGGLPGNTVVRELTQELTRYSDEAADLIRLHGSDIVDLVSDYGADAIRIIGLYGVDGVQVVSRYGDDGIHLADVFGEPAVRLLRVVDLDQAERLVDSLDLDVIGYITAEGPDAAEALTYWDDDLLRSDGMELALRAERDAVALQAAQDLAALDDLDSPQAEELIEIIARNSIQGDGDRLIIGKWVQGSLDEGFVGAAREADASYYGPNPGMEAAFSNLSPEDREIYFWEVNEEALRLAVVDELNIDYSLDGFDEIEIGKEIAAISAIESGNSEAAARIFGGRIPFRLREAEYLTEQGYTFRIDYESQIIHWTILPEAGD